MLQAGRFLHPVTDIVCNADIGFWVQGMAAHHNNAEVGSLLVERLGQGLAPHYRHHEVGEDQRDVGAMLGEKFQRLLAVGSFERVIVQHLQAAAQRRAGGDVVFHDQDRFSMAQGQGFL